MKESPTWLPVVAVALQREDGLWLAHRRPPGKHHAGLWEFPGGKVERGETPAQAAVREIEEELGVELDQADLSPVSFAHSVGDDVERSIVILLYRCAIWKGHPEPREGGEIEWFTLDRFAGLPKPPLDVALLAGLRKFVAV